jgi:hypothetical protein
MCSSRLCSACTSAPAAWEEAARCKGHATLAVQPHCANHSCSCSGRSLHPCLQRPCPTLCCAPCCAALRSPRRPPPSWCQTARLPGAPRTPPGRWARAPAASRTRWPATAGSAACRSGERVPAGRRDAYAA